MFLDLKKYVGSEITSHLDVLPCDLDIMFQTQDIIEHWR